jgi:hypothetical protein
MHKPYRPRLTEDEYKVVQKYKAFVKSAEKQGLDPKSVKHGWFKNKKTSLFAKNPGFKTNEETNLELIKDNVLEVLESKSIKVDRIEKKGDHLLIVDPADIHIGKLCDSFETGDTYNTKIAVERALSGVEGIIEKSKGFNVNRIMFIGGNDVLHIDTPKRTTTSGTPQDTDGMWYGNFLKAVELYKNIIDRLLNIAPVHFVYNPSNHDYTNGFFLCQLIEAYYYNNENITFDVDIRHRKYYRYGNNLIGSTHGDGAKMQDLPNLMAYESAKHWANTKHHYFFTHHLHHKVSKDLIGCTIEALRSPSGTDGWHHRNGYTGVPKAVEGILIHDTFGQVARLTNIF